MYNAVKNGNDLDWNYKRFICDTTEDKDEIDVSKIAPGSTALVIATKEEFILNNEKKWVLFIKHSGSSGGGSVSGDGYLTLDAIASVSDTSSYLDI
ncbi:MAG: hypothetical protein Q4E91_12615 [Lachnospiraceae bacterium]|nr:hypothetical protein [Lachnospiraceae bacterium]